MEMIWILIYAKRVLAVRIIAEIIHFVPIAGDNWKVGDEKGGREGEAAVRQIYGKNRQESWFKQILELWCRWVVN